MKKLILILAILPYIFTACVEEDNLPQYLGEFKLGPEGEAYIKFEPGSYWIYENTKSQKRDTIVMQWYTSEMLLFEGNLRSYHREDIKYFWKSNYGSYNTTIGHVYVDVTPEEAFKRGVIRFNMNTSKVSIGATCMIYFPFSFPSGGSISGQSTYLIKQHDSLQIQGKWYYTVAEFEVDNDPTYNTPNTDRTKYYWAKNIGLLRRVLVEEESKTEVESWEIIDYNVTQ